MSACRWTRSTSGATAPTAPRSRRPGTRELPRTGTTSRGRDGRDARSRATSSCRRHRRTQRTFCVHEYPRPLHRRRVGRAVRERHARGASTPPPSSSSPPFPPATPPTSTAPWPRRRRRSRVVRAARHRARQAPRPRSPTPARGPRRDEIARGHRPRSRHAEAPGAHRPGGRGHLRLLGCRGARDTFAFEDTSNGLVVREPVGVVGCITPWNYPLNQIGAKVAYALAAGCTVVLKPSEVAPVNAFILAEIMDEIGFPAGVFNLVSGLGPVVGEALAAHPDVDMVSFTGSTRAGKRVAELGGAVGEEGRARARRQVAVRDPRRRRLPERGGHAASTPPTRTRDRRATRCTRMLVPRSRLAEVEQLAREAAESYIVGDPVRRAHAARPADLFGPARPRARLHRKGYRRGRELVTGGADAPDGLDTGYFVQPTVFSNVTRDMTIAREGDLRTGAVDHPVRHRGRSDRDRQRHGLRAVRRGVRRRRARRSGSRARSAPDRCA